MNNVNYKKEGEKQIAALKGERAKLLLHCCCAPCSSACIEYLKPYFDITVYFYNPNIEDGEYQRRKAELIRFIGEVGDVQFLDCDYEEDEFYRAIKGLEDCKEGGARCAKCFSLRLDKTAQAAKTQGFDFFTTTLTISPLKDAALLNAIGSMLAKKYGVSWMYSDFKKSNGYLRSIQLSKEYGLYRQNYCGCKYSKTQTEL